MAKKKRWGNLKQMNAMSIERTLLANERTTLAYIRTGLTSFALGLALINFFKSTSSHYVLGVVTIVVGLIFTIFGGIIHYRRKREILGKH